MKSQVSEKFSSLFSNPKHPIRIAIAFGGTVILTSAIVTAAIVGVRQLGVLEGFELRSYDHFIRSLPPEEPDNRVLVVGITEEDIQKLKEESISDATMAKFLNKIEEYEPRAIGMDVLRDVPIGQGRQDLIKILKNNENIIAGCKLSSESEPGVAAAPGVPKERIGFADLPQDPDVIIRRSALVSTPTTPKGAVENIHVCNYADSENQVLSLAFNVALLYLDKDNIVPEDIEKGPNQGDIKLGAALFKRLGENVGGYRNLNAPDYQILIKYRSGEKAIPQVSLLDVLNGKINPDLVKDRVVMIGYTATTKNDDFPTPYSAGKQDRVEMPGVLIHAHIVSQIISAVWDNRPLIWYWPFGGEVLWIFGWSIVGGTLAWSIRRPFLFILASGGAIAILYGVSYFLFLQSGWIPLIPAGLAVVGSAGVVILIDRYSKTVTQAVKKLFRMEVEIDTDKVAAEVEAITETETFQILKQRAAERKNLTKNTNDRDVSHPTPETLAEMPITQEIKITETDAMGDLPQQKEEELSINQEKEEELSIRQNDVNNQ
jgi:CHASE2 domain-containing sensor protein